jgi:hypothetical protein
MKTITQNVNLQKLIENLEAAFNQYIFLIHQKKFSPAILGMKSQINGSTKADFDCQILTSLNREIHPNVNQQSFIIACSFRFVYISIWSACFQIHFTQERKGSKC